ncbi:MAG: hypothetical protein L0I76_13755 [Pseudonocardia sp.]|nr:hypothetical protein [Pseudonocardia sp.]
MTVPGARAPNGAATVLDDRGATVIILTGLPVSVWPTGWQVAWLILLLIAGLVGRYGPRLDPSAATG